MIAQIVTDEKTGNPIDGNGNSLAKSIYNPPQEVKELFSHVQTDYQTAYMLQHKGWDEFDGVSLLERAKLDQRTFGAYVGAEYVPQHKRWRWKGRKNTARNKIIGILSHLLAGMLFPFVYAFNNENEEDKMTARVMRILIEDHLKKADYEIKFLSMVCSALVNPAVIVGVEYIEAMQRIKQKLADGKIKVIEAVDELLSGLNLNIIPIDQFMIADFYTPDIQKQPFVIRLRRIPYDEARKIYKGKYIYDGVDQFDFVRAGTTHVMIAGSEGQTLYDIDWSEADKNFVQEITIYYRPEDLEATFVGGVFLGNIKDIYNSNPFKHRRFGLIGNEWISVPIVPYAKSGFEPLDPAGRFFYYKSAAFKEYWDDAAVNKMHQIAYDGTYLDVFKPIFMSGVVNASGTVIIPGATIGMPAGAVANPYSLGPNLGAALRMLEEERKDLAESTQDKIMSGITEKGITAYATAKAEQNARIFLGVFGLFIADLITKVGELCMDCIIQHTTVGEVDATVPESLKMKYRTFVMKGKDKGKDITNQIRFTDKWMGKESSKEDMRKREWELFREMGGESTDQNVYEVNPYKFARHKFSLYINADQITMRSMGADKLRKERAFAMLTDPRVLPFTDPEAVANDFVIEEYSDGDPDKYKRKEGQEDLLNMMMGTSQEAKVGSSNKLNQTYE